MIKTYSGFKGLIFFLGLSAGILLLVYLCGWGIARTSELLLPGISFLCHVLILIFLLAVLPLSLVEKLRPDLSRYVLGMSRILGAASWMLSFFFIMTQLGAWGIIFGFSFRFLVMIALVGAILKASWQTGFELGIWVFFFFVMKYFSRWLAARSLHKSQRQIIDVEIEDVK